MQTNFPESFQKTSAGHGAYHSSPAAATCCRVDFRSVCGKMPRLQQLSLHNNGFVGVLPDFILARSLVILTLHNNAISGPLPKRFFSELPNLAILTLHGNSLTGSIADGMSLKEPCLDNPGFELRGLDCHDWGGRDLGWLQGFGISRS